MNKNTKRAAKALRKAGSYYHGQICDTRGNGCKWPRIEKHVFVTARAAVLKAKGMYEI